MVAAIGVWVLELPLGAAVLLGAILAPTDPVLASGVQSDPGSHPDRLGFSLAGEGGLNDGAAFPFVMLGLGLLGTARTGPRPGPLVEHRPAVGHAGRHRYRRCAGRGDRAAGRLPAQPP